MIAPDRRLSCAPARRIILKVRRIMLWVAALLASIIWVLGLESGFLGFGIHVFLLAALLSGLAALLPSAHRADPAAQPEADPAPTPASSVPAPEGEILPATDAIADEERGTV